MIWNIVREEKRIAAELLQLNLDFGADFAKLKPESAFRIAPLNRSTRPLQITKIPPEYHHLIAEWALQDVLFSYLNEFNQNTTLYGWCHGLFKVRGLRADELIYKLKAQRECLREIMALPWYCQLPRKALAFINLNDPHVKRYRKQGLSSGTDP